MKALATTVLVQTAVVFAVCAVQTAKLPLHDRVYLPLENVGGKPVLRIALPTDKQMP